MESKMRYRPRWMKEIAGEIQPLKDSQLRRWMINLYIAIRNRVKENHASAIIIVQLEHNIVVQCEKVFQQYKRVVTEEVVTGKVDSTVVARRAKISLLTKQLFERASQYVTADEGEILKLEQVMSDFMFDFTLHSWPGLKAT